MIDTASKYLNRELSWLEFNQRVLDEARDESIPLLERLKFLAITSSNLDEFFMVRVGGLQMLSEQGDTKTDPAGLTPDQQLERISNRTHQMTVDQYTCLLAELDSGLQAAGINRVDPADLSRRQMQFLESLFDDELHSVLTPMAVATGEDFPLLFNRTLNVCVQLKSVSGGDEQPRFAVIPFGRSANRFITLPSDGGYDYILLEEVVGMFVERFFPGEPVVECVPFRITRNADLSVREDQASDLLAQMVEALDARRVGDCVRLEISDRVTSDMRAFLQATLDVTDESVYAVRGPLDLSAFFQLTNLQGFDELKYQPWPPKPPATIDPALSMFEVISSDDVLLYHPYDSFDPVVRLIEEAADDPDVLAIKQTLYRTTKNSPVVKALMKAAQNGKYVSVIVELKARFDEEQNIEQAKALEKAGGQVIYGVRGLKTHSKICVIVRREPQGIQRYVHLGTGNYNESTARLYSDASYMSCDEELGADAISFFNAVTGFSQPQRLRKLEAAPIGLREKLLEMIETETQRKRQGQNAAIMAKFNSLVDSKIIDALYEASQAGVPIQLNVRGICCLRPSVPGLSDNIEVISIIDRFLEHSRIFYFFHGGDELVFISSADWMPRNLDRRVELLIPIENRSCADRLITILELYFSDTVKARRLLADGSYEPVQSKRSQAPVRSQETLYRQTLETVKQADQSRGTMFEPHHAPSSQN